MENLNSMVDKLLLDSLKHLVARERKAQSLFLSHLIEVDKRKLYLSEGYSSLFSYVHEVLGFSEASTYKRIHEYKTNLKSAIPFLYFYSDEAPTINQALWYKKEQILLFPGKNLLNSLKTYDEEQLLSKGDGTVTENSAQPPEQFATTFPNLRIRKRAGSRSIF